MKVLRVTMPDGSEWDIPAEVIAKSRANILVRDRETTFEEEFRLAMEDNGAIADWAHNHMNWRDVVQHATRSKPPVVISLDGAWPNADKEVVEV